MDVARIVVCGEEKHGRTASGVRSWALPVAPTFSPSSSVVGESAGRPRARWGCVNEQRPPLGGGTDLEAS